MGHKDLTNLIRSWPNELRKQKYAVRKFETNNAFQFSSEGTMELARLDFFSKQCR